MGRVGRFGLLGRVEFLAGGQLCSCILNLASVTRWHSLLSIPSKLCLLSPAPLKRLLTALLPRFSIKGCGSEGGLALKQR